MTNDMPAPEEPLKSTSRPDPEREPPTKEEFNSAIMRLVGFRKTRAALISHMAVMDGLNRGCLRWYYIQYPVEFERKGRTLQPTDFKRRLVIDRVYSPVEEGITVKWNQWCVDWDLPFLQVFTPAQATARESAGLPTRFRDPGDEFIEAPKDEVEEAIIAASEEFGLDLEAPVEKKPHAVPTPPSSSGKTADLESADGRSSRPGGTLDTTSLQEAERLLHQPPPDIRVEPAREPKFWEGSTEDDE